MPFASLRAEAPRFARRLAAAVLRAAAAILALLIAIIYALGAAHAALAAEIGPIRANLALAGALFLVALLLLLVARNGAKQARAGVAVAVAYDYGEVRRRSLNFVRNAGRFAAMRWMPLALRAVRATPWRLAIGFAALAGAVFLLWPYLRREWRPATARRGPAPPAV